MKEVTVAGFMKRLNVLIETKGGEGVCVCGFWKLPFSLSLPVS